MKKFLPFALFMALTAGAIVFMPKYVPVGEEDEEDKQDQIEKAWEWDAFLTRDPATGTVPRDRLLKAMEKKTEMLELMYAQKTSGAVSGISWVERGPNNVGGRTRALMYDRNDVANGYKKVWAAGVAGGLWYTNDITATPVIWNKVDDFMDNLAITAIAQSPVNPQTMYFATGEGWGNTDAVRGLGVWKTVNGGATWTRLTSTSNFTLINDILVDSYGNVFIACSGRGIHRSTDGGLSWNQVLGTTQNGADLEIAANGDLYASMHSTSGGVYVSRKATHTTNVGSSGTWTDITPNSSGTITGSNSSWRRIELAVAPSNANVVYALFSNNSNCTSIQRYNGASWSVKTIPTITDQGSNSNFARGQAWYDLIAAVDPNDENAVYIGGIDACRSLDGGTTWDQISNWAANTSSDQYVHADHHAYTFKPGSSDTLLMGTDGGLFYTVNAKSSGFMGFPAFVSKNNGYNVTQFYGAAISPTVTNYMLAGAQDNGTQKFNGGSGLVNTSVATGGDGGFCHIDPLNHNLQITSYVYNQYRVSTNGGTSFSTVNLSNNTGGFINPTAFDKNSKILYAAENAGKFLRWNNPGSGNSYDVITVNEFSGGQVTTVTVSPVTANRVYFGLSNGNVVYVDNANTGTGTKTGVLLKFSFEQAAVSGIYIDPNNENRIIISSSNYGVENVAYTSDALGVSPTWISADGNLPDMPVRNVMFDPRSNNMAIIATELGVWSTDNLNGLNTDWQPTNSGLANVRVDQLLYRASDRTLVAATHGRGLFTAIVPTTIPVTWLSVNGMAAKDANLINWKVANEENCKEYKVERKNAAGEYITVATVKATSGTGDKTYEFADAGFDKNLSKFIYRIKQMDFDGKSSYSKEVLVNRSTEQKFVEFVNNDRNYLTVRFKNAVAGKATVVTIYDASGRTLLRKVATAQTSVFDITALSSGAYFLTVEGNGDMFKTKFAK